MIPTALTTRQRELIDLALMGLSDKAIARRLAISDYNFRAIHERLGASKRNHLLALLE